MKWIKIGQIGSHISISEQKARELVKNNVWIKGLHYVDNPYIHHRLFNLQELEKWLLDSDSIITKNEMQNFLKDW